MKKLIQKLILFLVQLFKGKKAIQNELEKAGFFKPAEIAKAIRKVRGRSTYLSHTTQAKRRKHRRSNPCVNRYGLKTK